jgi:fructokinase
MYDVIGIGELLIDFTPNGQNDAGMALFARNPGGGPPNVLTMIARLGGRTAFIGKVGQDDFGRFLKKTLDDAGICTSGLVMVSDVNTTLAFVQLNEKGDRSFSFYRKPGADMMLREDEIDKNLVTNCRIFHFSSVSLTDEPCRSATLHAVKLAKDVGRIISYDPNYRPLLWNNPLEAKKVICDALPLADILKVSEEEMELLTGETNLEKGAERLSLLGAALVLITLGPKGAYYRNKVASGTIHTYDVKTIDTTGAGDSFLGAVQFSIRNKTIEEIRIMDKAQLDEMISFANAAGSLTTTKKGAIPAMPSLEEIKACQSSIPFLK